MRTWRLRDSLQLARSQDKEHDSTLCDLVAEIRVLSLKNKHHSPAAYDRCWLAFIGRRHWRLQEPRWRSAIRSFRNLNGSGSSAVLGGMLGTWSTSFTARETSVDNLSNVLSLSDRHTAVGVQGVLFRGNLNMTLGLALASALFSA